MKAIVQIQMKLSHNSEFDALTSNLLKLKICGKEILSYYFDLLNELEVSKIYLIGDDLKGLIDEFYLSEVFSPKLEFIDNKNADEFYMENIDSFRGDDLLMIKNIGFIFNPFHNIKQKIQRQKENFILRDENFQIEYIKFHLKPFFLLNEIDMISIKSIAKMEDYIFVQDFILNKLDEVDYTYGYSSEDGIVIGKNVQIHKSVKLTAPLVILDDVKISANCSIGPNTILSNNVYIENNTNILNSIICDNTYIGINLNIVDKIVIENKIIDKNSLEDYEIDTKLLDENKKILF